MPSETPGKFEPRHELRTPLELTNDMDRALFFSKRGTAKLHELRQALLAAKSAYQRKAEERKLELKLENPRMSIEDRDAQARSENWDLYIAMCEAEAEFDFAKDKLKDLEKELSKSQSEAKLVIKEMEMAR